MELGRRVIVDQAEYVGEQSLQIDGAAACSPLRHLDRMINNHTTGTICDVGMTGFHPATGCGQWPQWGMRSGSRGEG
jgi:hypothetical protein